jgi:hypothetical protein
MFFSPQDKAFWTVPVCSNLIGERIGKQREQLSAVAYQRWEFVLTAMKLRYRRSSRFSSAFVSVFGLWPKKILRWQLLI